MIQDNWDTPLIKQETSFALEDSLHGREILAVCGLQLKNGKTLVVTGSEDTYAKVGLFDGTSLTSLQTFSDHVASVRSLCKLKLSNGDHLIVSAGSRLEANVY